MVLARDGGSEGEHRLVRVEGGMLEGKAGPRAWEFMGIPYARAPLGGLRWKPPQPLEPWEGVRPCSGFAESCAQPAGAAYRLGRLGEDCLYLNIWAPRGREPQKLPVMVWIHGGAFISGSASVQLEPGVHLYNGGELAEKGIVVVTINYRLGPFGFLAHPLLDRESPRGVSGNYGLLDQIAALRWVGENIEAFGGDPSNITVFGQSAGATSIYLLMVAPMASGLFQRAVCMSGPLWISMGLPAACQELEEAERTGRELARRLGFEGPGAIAGMRATPADRILEATELDKGLFAGSMDFGPVLDGWLLPFRPERLYSDRHQERVNVIAGWAERDADYFMNLYDVSLKGYESYVHEMAGPYAERVLDLYPADNHSVSSVFARLLTTFEFQAPSRFLAHCMQEAGCKAFLYRFGRVPPGPGGRPLCACHGTDIPYFFGDVRDEEYYDSCDLRLSRLMMEYLVNFARTGDPNAGGLPPWPEYDARSEAVLEFNRETAVIPMPDRAACELAEKIHVGENA